MTSMVSADDTEQTDVNVSVSEITELDVRPSSLQYDQVEPGQDVVVSDNSEGFAHVDVENIGSNRIAAVTARASMPDTQPFGTTPTEAVSHDTANFVTVSTETANAEGVDGIASNDEDQVPTFLTRTEYVEENAPQYITVEEGDVDGSERDRTDVGRIRAGDVEYFYVVYYDTSRNDIDNNVIVRVGNTPHTSTDLGTTDFSNDGTDYTEYLSSDLSPADGATDDYFQINEQDIVAFDADATNFTGQSLIDDGNAIQSEVDDIDSADVREYNLLGAFENDAISAVDDDTNGQHFIRTRYTSAVESPNGAVQTNEITSGAQGPILGASDEDNQLQPGENFPIDIGLEVPQGTDADFIEEGTVTFIASEDPL